MERSASCYGTPHYPPAGSPSTATAARTYDVFINCHGPDVKPTLASTIYYWLQSTELRVFFDADTSQNSTEELSPAITDAVRTASVHVAIFSKKYAESLGCLEELCLMLESGRRIVPVFYDVQPSDLRWAEKGAYAHAFAQHEKNGKFSYIKRWKESLKRVSMFSGFELQNKFNGDHGRLLKTIVDTVLKYVKKVPLDVGRDSVGLDEAVADFENFTENGGQQGEKEKVMIVGIVGLGGSGKSTLAKEVYNRKRSLFDASSFLFDIREAAARKMLHTLQTKLLKDLLNFDCEITSISEGKGILRRRLHLSPRVLIVLDDVDHQNQVEDLLVKDVLGRGSLVILTSRNEGVLRLSEASTIYKVKGLGPDHARELFCRHAFRQPHPIDGFEDLVRKSLNKCGGLPLFLKVIGGHLHLYGGNNRDYWERELKKISGIPDILKVSYDALGEEEKRMFLDIACSSVGEDMNSAIKKWDESGLNGPRGLQMLKHRCLVEFDDQKRIKMHDHLRHLGIETAAERSPQLKGGREVRGIVACASEVNSCGYRECKSSYFPPFEEIEVLGSSVGLDLLHIEGNCLQSQFRELTRDVIWLRWYGCPHGSLPAWLSMKNLVVLELLGGTFEELWHSDEQLPLQLKELKIVNDGLGKIPKLIGSLYNLEKVFLHGLSDESLPEGFCDLSFLKHIELRKCVNLTTLPNRLENLRNLKYIGFHHCRSLKTLPSSFGHLTQLQSLDLCYCENLELKPESFGKIATLERVDCLASGKLGILPTQITNQGFLRTLDLLGTRLQELPNDIGKLGNLQLLRIGSPFWKSLPSSLGNLTRLTELELRGCRQMKYLPESLGWLKLLVDLKIDSSGIESLPNGIRQLTNLQTLTIWSCPISELALANARSFVRKEVPVLRKVGVSSILDFSNCRGMVGLTRIHLNCTKVSKISIPDDCCPNLKSLMLQGNEYLTDVGTLPTSLEDLSLSSSPQLKRISGISDLATLQRLEIVNCDKVDSLPSLARGSRTPGSSSIHRCVFRLKYLSLVCTRVSKISISGHDCPNLEVLNLSFNSFLIEVGTLPRTLKCLRLEGCSALKMISGITDLIKLSKLDIFGCSELDELPNLEHLKSLERVEASGCWKIRRIGGLDRLERLAYLKLSADNRAIWNAIQRLQKLPDNLSTMVLCGRPASDLFDFGELPVVDFVSRDDHWALEMAAWTEIEVTWSAVMICFVVHCSAEAMFDQPQIPIWLFPREEEDDCISVKEGEWICTTLFKRDSWFLEEAGRTHEKELKFSKDRYSRYQVNKGWMVIVSQGNERKIFEVLNKLYVE